MKLLLFLFYKTFSIVTKHSFISESPARSSSILLSCVHRASSSSYRDERGEKREEIEGKDRDSIPQPLEWQSSTLTARLRHSPEVIVVTNLFRFLLQKPLQ